MVLSPANVRVKLALRAFLIAGTVMVVVVNLLTVIYLTSIAQQGAVSRATTQTIAKQNKALAQRILECTTPPALRKQPESKPRADDCYVRSQASTTELLGEPSGPINAVTVAAAACGAANPGDVAATLRCTRKAVGDIDRSAVHQ